MAPSWQHVAASEGGADSGGGLPQVNGHELRHVMLQGRSTPACTCGWYSPRWQHADFEKHIKRFSDDNCGIDHGVRCCPDHGTHSEPHKGCILR
jgi:hypothetical protein